MLIAKMLKDSLIFNKNRLQEPFLKNFNNFAMYVFLGGTYIFEIFVLIYYGNEIALASDQLSFRVYESNWMCMPIKCRKLMIIIMEQWRKPQELIVGKIFPMRIKLLTSVNM